MARKIVEEFWLTKAGQSSALKDEKLEAEAIS